MHKIKVIKYNDNDIVSIKRAERQKFNLECKGYNLINTRLSFYGNVLTYKKGATNGFI